jgi:hypothetical protein
MPNKKESSTSDKRGISAPSTKHVQEKMESGNPTPAAEPSKRASGGKSSKKGGKK